MNKKVKNIVFIFTMMITLCSLAVAYTPEGDPNLVTWFRADKGVVTQNDLDPGDPNYVLDGTGVMVWEDQSGYDFDAQTFFPNVYPQKATAAAPNGRTVDEIRFSNDSFLEV